MHLPFRSRSKSACVSLEQGQRYTKLYTSLALKFVSVFLTSDYRNIISGIVVGESSKPKICFYTTRDKHTRKVTRSLVDYLCVFSKNF